MTGKISRQWLQACLIPEMAAGSIVVADNLPAHKVSGIRQCLEMVLAETVGFEPTIELPLYTLSKRAPSTTRPRLRMPFRAQRL
jgi:uncharacterized protein YqcC (DUF446 family)